MSYPLLTLALGALSFVLLLCVLVPPAFQPGDPALTVRRTRPARRFLQLSCLSLWLVTVYVGTVQSDRRAIAIALLSLAVFLLLAVVSSPLWHGDRSAMAAAALWQAKYPRPAIEDEPELHQLWNAMEAAAYGRQGRLLFGPADRLSREYGPAMWLFLEERQGNLQRFLRGSEGLTEAWRTAIAKYDAMSYQDIRAMEVTYRALRRIEPR